MTQRPRQAASSAAAAGPSSSSGSTENLSGPSQPRRQRKARPGVAALREIRFYQRSTENLLPKKPFQRLVRETLNTLRGPAFTKFTSEALAALQVAAEMYVVEIFGEVNLYAIHAKRVTIQVKDQELCKTIREMHGIGLEDIDV